MTSYLQQTRTMETHKLRVIDSLMRANEMFLLNKNMFARTTIDKNLHLIHCMYNADFNMTVEYQLTRIATHENIDSFVRRWTQG